MALRSAAISSSSPLEALHSAVEALRRAAVRWEGGAEARCSERSSFLMKLALGLSLWRREVEVEVEVEVKECMFVGGSLR